MTNVRMTNDEVNDEIQMTNGKPSIAFSSFEHSSLFRHSSFVLRHLLAFVY